MPVFTANIPGILKVGDRIEIGGKIKENARKMSVNLCAQEGEEPRDVVLHFDVRFHRDNIISLSRRNGVWIGSGNLDTNYNMFVPGTIFRIIFEVKDTDVITIYCQGKFHSNFLPKIPLTMARYLVAWADVDKITHCYFQMNDKGVGDEAAAIGANSPSSRQGITPVLIGDVKRCVKSHRKSSPSSPHIHSSNESSDDEQKPRCKAEGRADRYFYETLMCQPPETTFGNKNPKYHREIVQPEYSRKYRNEYIEKNETDTSEEVASKNMESTAESDDVLPELGLINKRNRRGKFASFAQVVNFMGKTARRN
ncbi:jg6520 [Pararge aegeria aegeria]|uniref:Galectin n=1 Tax=Pararge aegeria aegeria TaxID=348720 RepID=A0A8S4S202_9NEOP|nr:jg6520 [Pararge aegeria aegeria]